MRATSIVSAIISLKAEYCTIVFIDEEKGIAKSQIKTRQNL